MNKKFNAQKVIDEHGGKCITKGGMEYVIYAIYPEQRYSIHGAVKGEDGCWVASARTITGKFWSDSVGNLDDLIMPKQALSERWVYVYPKGYVAMCGYDDGSRHDYIAVYKDTYYDDGTRETERLK